MPIIQPSFAAGELAPSLWSRVDLAKYHVGAALLRNFFIDYRGGAANRPGTMFVNQVKDSTKPVRLIPFQFSTVQTYILEFGHLYMRVIMNGGHVLEPSGNITGATQANPCVITQNAHGYATGDWVFISGVGGMTQLNSKYFIVTVLTANTYSLSNLNGVAINSAAYGAYTAGGTAARVFTLVTPYAASDLALLKFTQSADVMTLTHTAYAPRNLTRTAHYIWTLTAITFSPTQGAPTITAVTPSTAGATGYKYVVTAISADGTEESLPSNAVNGASVPMSTTAGAYVTVTWTAPAGTQPSRYNIYRTDETIGVSPPAAGSIFGYVGSTDGTALTFLDQNTLEDLTNAPPTAANPFAAGNNPGCVAYYQGRRFYAGSTSGPQTVWGSRSACFNNMDTTFPSKATDALTASILSQQVNAVQFMVPLTALLVLTKGGAWKLWSGNQSEAITPSAITADPQVYNGCNDKVPPIIVNYDILYVQSKGAIVRDLSYNLYLNVFTGTDLTILSNHLFQGHTILEWAWSEEPNKMVWAVRDDGVLLGFTYLKEQDVYAWTRHDTTNGLFLSVASISEGAEDAVYFVVKRLINGNYVQYIERLASRTFTNAGVADVTQAWFVDCGLRYTLGTPNANVTPSASTANGFLKDNVVGGVITITADAAVFTNADVGNIIRINGGRGTVSTFVNANTVLVTLMVPLNSIWPAATGSWTYTVPIKTINQLDHLEGQTVAILADGGVQGQRVVQNGTITLDQACADIIIGLPIQSQLQSLYIDANAPGNTTIQGKPMAVNACTIRVKDSRGLKIGNKFSTVVPIKERTQNTNLGTFAPLITGDERMPLDPLYTQTPQVCIQQDDPLPAQILGIIPEISLAAS